MKTIAWDVDDVLNDLMRSWLEGKWVAEHPECRLRYEEICENPPLHPLNTSLETYLSSLDEFRLSPSYQQLSPLREVLEWFQTNGSAFRHIALTAVPHKAASASAQWVMRNFGAWIRTFHFVPSHRAGADIPIYDEDKSSFLRWIRRVDFLVDDSADHVTAAADSGIRSFLFPRPWNKGQKSIAELLKELANA